MSELTPKLMEIAEKITSLSKGRVRLAHNEEDETTDLQPEAAHFFKVDGKRVGRDIELYGFMSKAASVPAAIADFAEVVCHCAATVDHEHNGNSVVMPAIREEMIALADDGVDPETRNAWAALWEDEEADEIQNGS